MYKSNHLLKSLIIFVLSSGCIYAMNDKVKQKASLPYPTEENPEDDKKEALSLWSCSPFILAKINLFLFKWCTNPVEEKLRKKLKEE